MNEMRVASIPFAAYFVISAEAMSMKMIGFPVRYERRVNLRHYFARVIARDAKDDAVGLHEIIDLPRPL
jgi:hypothetical protein